MDGDPNGIEAEQGGRAECPRCRRPGALCVCAVLQPIAHATGVTVVQHPAERGHAFNTARLVPLALADAQLQVAWDGGRLDPPALPPGAALLWPGPQAVDLAQIPPARRPTHLVVVDGTWPQARSMYRANPWMAALPQVRLSPQAPSAYRIRREPAAHCLSTIESVAQALRLIEPENAALDGVLSGFHALIDGQLQARERRPAAPRALASKPRAVERLEDGWAGLVVVYAETTPLSRDPRDREIAQWAALRVATGEVFDGFARPSALPDPCQLAQMGLDAAALQAAPPAAQLASAWAAFRRPTDRFAAWSRGGAQAGFFRIEGQLPPLFDLKSLYCNAVRGRSGTLDRVVAREGLALAPVAVRGRAGHRLACSAAVAGWLAQRGAALRARRQG